MSPWFSPDWRVLYAKLLAEMQWLEALARAARKRLTP